MKKAGQRPAPMDMLSVYFASSTSTAVYICKFSSSCLSVWYQPKEH